MSVTKIKDDAAFIHKAGMELMTFLGARKLFPTIPPARRERAHKTKAARKKRRKAMLKGS